MFREEVQNQASLKQAPLAQQENKEQYGFFRRLYELLVAPHPNVREPAQQRQARLLSALLLFIVIQAIPATLVVIITNDEVRPLSNPFLYVALPTEATFLVAYFLSRGPRYILGAYLSILMLPVFTLAGALTADVRVFGAGELLFWLVLSVAIASIFFSVRLTATLAAVNVALVVFLPIVWSEIAAADILHAVIFNIIVSTAVVVSGHHRNQVELDRQRSLAESELRYRTLLETVFDGIILHDNETIYQANPGFAEMFGFDDPEQLVGVSLTSFSVSGTGNRLIAEEMAKGLKQVHEVPAIRRDGTRLTVEVVGKSQPYLGQTVQMAAVRDISERKRAEAAEYRRRVLAESLRDTAAALNSTLDLNEVLERILENVNRVVPHNAASIVIISDAEGIVSRARGYHMKELKNGFSFELADIPYIQEMLRTAEPVIVKDTGASTEWVDIFDADWQGSLLSAPIILEGRVIGFLNLESQQPGFFTVSQADDLKTFADQAGLAIANATLYKQLREWSSSLETAVQARTVELRRTKEQLEVILNNSPEIILLLDVDGVVIAANQAVERELGYNVDNIRGTSLKSLAAQSDEAAIVSALRKAITLKEVQHIELLACRSTGAEFDADLFITPVTEDNEVINLVASIRDITSLKEVERLKDAFVSNVSHELRAPITSLKLQQALLRLKPQDKDRISVRIEREIARLQYIIEDLLRLSRLEQNRVDLEWEEIDLNHLVEDYVGDRYELARSQGLNLIRRAETGPTPPVVRGDAGLLGQVLSILLTNAMDYTPVGGEIVVTTASQERPEGPGAIIRVEDNGPGISQDDIDHIFERFYRGEAGRQSQAPGTGLGLAIAKEIVQRHGGTISVASARENGAGARFEVWLPAADSSHSPD
jgi:PAS domain S-box-containing protein